MPERPAILCIDDDPYVCDLYRQTFEHDGYAVVCELDAPTGLASAKRLKPALIVLDVMMPETDGFRDGFELLTRLRKDDDCAETPIIVVSGLGDGGDLRHGLDLGADDYLPKQDMTPKKLLAKVHALLGPKK